MRAIPDIHVNITGTLDPMLVLALCHVEIAGINYDLRMWKHELRLSKIRAWHEKGRVIHRRQGERIYVFDAETDELYGSYSREEAEELDAALSNAP